MCRRWRRAHRHGRGRSTRRPASCSYCRMTRHKCASKARQALGARWPRRGRSQGRAMPLPGGTWRGVPTACSWPLPAATAQSSCTVLQTVRMLAQPKALLGGRGRTLTCCRARAHLGALVGTLLGTATGRPTPAGYMAPLAGVALCAPPRWPTHNGHSYAYELLLCTLAGGVECYLLAPATAPPPGGPCVRRRPSGCPFV
jgi:hypothetical protein